MTLPGAEARLTNWSKSAYSQCFVYKAGGAAEISRALAEARTRRLTVIPHGAGHSYTDAALNSGGAVIDVTPMHRILAWDAAQGIMRVEPGVTMRQVVQVAAQDGWWPVVSPSTPEVTIGGCAAMNVNGRNAWKCGPFGSHVLSLDVLLVNGESLTLAPEREPQLFQAFVGSMGLLGIITSITIQLEQISSGYVTIRRRYAHSFAEALTLFADEESSSDFMEAWIDGFATGAQLGRGILTCASLSDARGGPHSREAVPGTLGKLQTSLVNLAARLSRPVLMPVLKPAAQTANRAHYWWGQSGPQTTAQRRLLFPYTYWPSAALIGYHGMFPDGVETFQAFVPREHAREIFERLLCYSQGQGCMPIWCVVKGHRRDPFLLSYQVDGFSLELNYQRTPQTAQKLKQVLQHMIQIVIEAGGRFYLAKDQFLTHAQYRQSLGAEAVDTFLQLKQRYDPEMTLQSDLFRRIFLAGNS